MNESIMNKAHQQAVDNLNSYTMVGKVTENLKLEDIKMPDEYGYTTISEFHNLIKHDDPLYKEGFKAGAASERIITLQDDDHLRFIKRVLESDDSTEQDKNECLRLIHEIRTRIRATGPKQ